MRELTKSVKANSTAAYRLRGTNMRHAAQSKRLAGSQRGEGAWRKREGERRAEQQAAVEADSETEKWGRETRGWVGAYAQGSGQLHLLWGAAGVVAAQSEQRARASRVHAPGLALDPLHLPLLLLARPATLSSRARSHSAAPARLRDRDKTLATLPQLSTPENNARRIRARSALWPTSATQMASWCAEPRLQTLGKSTD